MHGANMAACCLISRLIFAPVGKVETESQSVHFPWKSNGNLLTLLFPCAADIPEAISANVAVRSVTSCCMWNLSRSLFSLSPGHKIWVRMTEGRLLYCQSNETITGLVIGKN